MIVGKSCMVMKHFFMINGFIKNLVGILLIRILLTMLWEKPNKHISHIKGDHDNMSK